MAPSRKDMSMRIQCFIDKEDDTLGHFGGAYICSRLKEVLCKEHSHASNASMNWPGEPKRGQCCLEMTSKKMSSLAKKNKKGKSGMEERGCKKCSFTARRRCKKDKSYLCIVHYHSGKCCEERVGVDKHIETYLSDKKGESAKSMSAKKTKKVVCGKRGRKNICTSKTPLYRCSRGSEEAFYCYLHSHLSLGFFCCKLDWNLNNETDPTYESEGIQVRNEFTKRSGGESSYAFKECTTTTDDGDDENKCEGGKGGKKCNKDGGYFCEKRVKFYCINHCHSGSCCELLVDGVDSEGAGKIEPLKEVKFANS